MQQGLLLACAAATLGAAPPCRDRHAQPFASDSPWKSVGAGAALPHPPRQISPPD
jgi:hypothetical protein